MQRATTVAHNSHRAGRETASEGTARRVARNTAAPLAATLVNRGLAWGLAIYAARVLGPGGVGAYAFAQNLWLYAAILADFGLGTLLTRDVARARDTAPRLVASTLALRLGLVALCAPAAVIAAVAYRAAGAADSATVLTVALLVAGLLPGAVAGTLSALFSGYERMTVPAAVQVVTGVLTTGLGVTVLALGWGIVGLGTVALVVGIVTAIIFVWLTRRLLFRPGLGWHPSRMVGHLREAWPLMLNSLLNGLFFRNDIQILQATHGSREVGHYANAYKIVDAVGLIPSSFVLALFPLLSRHAAAGTDSFLAVYRLALKLLLAVAVPIALGITILAHDLTGWLWGPEFLPQSAIALQIVIWYVPGSFWNGLTQYVLIALGLQRRITAAFALGTIFNLGANLLLVPRFGLIAAAAVTVASEIVLLVPFAIAVHRRLGTIPLWHEARVPLIAGAAMAGAALASRYMGSPALVAVVSGLIVYTAGWLALRPLSAQEWHTLSGLWPRR